MTGNCRCLRGQWLLVLTGIALAILTILPFARAIGLGLHNFDDYTYLTECPLTDLFNVRDSIWMPLTRLSYLADSLVWGDWWGGFHLTSLMIHAFNATLLLAFLWQISLKLGLRDRWWVPFLAALVWSVHPLRCESVILLSSRKDVLSLFFELIALNLWISPWSRRRGVSGLVADGLSLVCFALGACCKPSVMTFPILCLMVDAFIMREVRPFRYVVPVVMMIGLGPFAAWQQAVGGAARNMFGQPLVERVIGAAAAFGIYVRNEIWPSSLAVQCIKKWPVWPDFWLPGLVISGLCACYLYRRLKDAWNLRSQIRVAERTSEGMPLCLVSGRSVDPLFVSVAWFVVAVWPMLGIASFGYHAFADRFTYIPSIGFSIALVWLVGRGRWLVSAGLVLVVLALGVRTVCQCRYWENDETLFTHTLEVDGDGNTSAHIALANWYWDVPHDLEKCVSEFEKVEKLDFTFAVESFELYIFALCELGRTERIPEILSHFEETVVGMFGKDAWAQAWAEEGDRGPAEKYRWIYQMSKAAWWLTDPHFVSQTAEFLAQTRAWGKKRNVVWLYVNWKLNEVRHGVNSAEAIAARKKLSQDGARAGYIQFRYLRDDLLPRRDP